MISLGQTSHLLFLEGLVCWVRSLLGPFPTVSGSPHPSPPAWDLGVQLLVELTWQLGHSPAPGRLWKPTEQRRMASLAGYQLTLMAALWCPGVWPEEPGTWPPPGGGTRSPQSALRLALSLWGRNNESRDVIPNFGFSALERGMYFQGSCLQHRAYRYWCASI